MTYWMMVIVILGIGIGENCAAMECVGALENEAPQRTFSTHPKTLAIMKNHAAVFERQDNPSKALLLAGAAYQASLKNISDLEKTWTLFQGDFCERY